MNKHLTTCVISFLIGLFFLYIMKYSFCNCQVVEGQTQPNTKDRSSSCPKNVGIKEDGTAPSGACDPKVSAWANLCPETCAAAAAAADALAKAKAKAYAELICKTIGERDQMNNCCVAHKGSDALWTQVGADVACQCHGACTAGQEGQLCPKGTPGAPDSDYRCCGRKWISSNAQCPGAPPPPAATPPASACTENDENCDIDGHETCSRFTTHNPGKRCPHSMLYGCAKTCASIPKSYPVYDTFTHTPPTQPGTGQPVAGQPVVPASPPADYGGEVGW
jgi:hypothetical protein